MGSTSSEVQGEYDVEDLQAFIGERVELFSQKHFTKLTKFEISFTDNQGKVYIEFIPDFGSITFKNEIWQWSAAHAMNLIYIFPEIIEYHYAVYDSSNKKLMDLYLDETGVKMLPEKYYGQRGPGNYYRYCFTKVEETPLGKELPIDEKFFEGSGLP